MNAILRMLRGLIGLFVDDGLLALTLLGVLLGAGLLAQAQSLDRSLALGLLVVGSILALLANVLRAAAARKR